jgi:hypothetical protein
MIGPTDLLHPSPAPRGKISLKYNKALSICLTFFCQLCEEKPIASSFLMKINVHNSLDRGGTGLIPGRYFWGFEVNKLALGQGCLPVFLFDL